MPDIHPIARAGFGTDGDRYDSGRPGYPKDAIDWLVERLPIRPGAFVVDVAAGTGKLTRMLVPTGCSLHAVEPLSSMSAVLRRHSPSIPLSAATADDLPFEDGSVDTITVGQALHWFDTEETWIEFARILRIGGGVGLVWNARDRTEPWLARVWEIMDGAERTAPWRNHEEPGSFGFGKARAAFGPVESAQFRHEVSSTRAAMLDRVGSSSHIATLPEPERQALLDDVAAALPDAPEFTVPYRTDVYAVART